MKDLHLGIAALGIVALGIATLALLAAPLTAEEEPLPEGQQAFLDLKCNLCHSVPAAGIEAKTKSEKIKGPNLLAGEWERGLLARFIKQEAEVDGRQHKKEFKGSDEELMALVDWLLEQKTEG
jgi:cytochrome c5